MTRFPNIIAHRGFWNVSSKTSENSLQSLINAQKMSAFGSEFDVQMTKDHELIVYHDELCQGIEISETYFQDLQNIKLYNAEKLPLLKDFLIQGKKQLKTILVIELKPCSTDLLEKILVENTLELLEKHNIYHCQIISFSLVICQLVKRQRPNLEVFYLNGDLSPQQIVNHGLDGLDYHYKIFLNRPQWISEAGKLGLKTNAWNVNDVESYQKLKHFGIDYITTDIPDVLMKI